MLLNKSFHVALFVFLASVFAINANAERDLDDKPWTGLSVGTDAGMIAGDNFKVGARVSSPSFMSGWIRAAASGHIAWLQNAMSVADTNYSWPTYGLFKLGLHVGNFVHVVPIRVSTFLDVVMVTPSLKISDKAAIFGIDGGLDAELFYNLQHANFIALGGTGLFPATANGLKGKPTFASGFLISFGYRYYF